MNKQNIDGRVPALGEFLARFHAVDKLDSKKLDSKVPFSTQTRQHGSLLLTKAITGFPEVDKLDSRVP